MIRAIQSPFPSSPRSCNQFVDYLLHGSLRDALGGDLPVYPKLATRLAWMTAKLAKLRDEKEDFLSLHFLRVWSQKGNQPLQELDPETIFSLNHTWPRKDQILLYTTGAT